ncbi:MAG: 3-isopropylmalate dehydratase small subunit [Candidatus Eisenbacteria sp.]|nr:3-isopropylmalate dehydratase small subunit [Candidatus Eisenbacteria bacterium]
MVLRGRVWKYGDDVNTDVIFPGKYTYTITDPKEMAAHALEDLDPDFAGSVKAGDLVVAGRNFGCGSSREQAATCLKEAGVGAVIAESFSRIYFRNAINQGMPAIQFKDASQYIESGEEITVDLGKGEITCKAGTFNFPPLSEFMMGILEDGGLVPHTKKVLRKSST